MGHDHSATAVAIQADSVHSLSVICEKNIRATEARVPTPLAVVHSRLGPDMYPTGLRSPM